MENPFDRAEQYAQITITSDFQDTLVGTNLRNLTLLEDLSDARIAGCRVIICSTLAPHKIADNFNMLTMRGEREGYNVLPFDAFEQATKLQLREQGLTVDYAFDNESIKGQPLSNYVFPAVEIRIELDGGRSMPRNVFRALLELSPKPEFGPPDGTLPMREPA